MKTALRQIGIILWKDLLIDLRRKENLLAMVFFSLLTLLIFQFALGSADDLRYRLTPRALAMLENDGLSPAAHGDLQSLVGRTFATRNAFLQALRATGPQVVTGAERVAVLEAARRTTLQEGAPGLLWVTFLLAGLLGLSKSFSQERENGSMEGLLLTPAARGTIYLGKMGSNALFLLLLLAMVLPLFALLYQISLWGVLLPLCAVLLAGVLGFAALGTLLGGMTSTLQGKEVLLPLLLFPLLAPIVIIVVHLTGVILEGSPLAAEMDWVRLLAAVDAVFLIISYLVFDFVMET
ncbi:MAG: heme exporter protein CcmB [SAR324 cluster bacterium]|nr:heme exporter protein CcmB [SAR324 cluster bacterium]MCZ6629420.1 heme exporter protein CcmB [SAR324 cluster bacterium]MCZ6644631.1 heme exporter protein CcmB [SAR324 cluster bacterium]